MSTGPDRKGSRFRIDVTTHTAGLADSDPENARRWTVDSGFTAQLSPSQTGPHLVAENLMQFVPNRKRENVVHLLRVDTTNRSQIVLGGERAIRIAWIGGQDYQMLIPSRHKLLLQIGSGFLQSFGAGYTQTFHQTILSS